MSPEAVKQGIFFLRMLFAGGVGTLMMWMVVSALFEREIEAWQGAIGIGVVVTLCALTLSLAQSPWYFAALLAMVGLGAVWRLARLAEANAAKARMLEDDEHKYLAAIADDPRNAAAHAFLAAVYEKQERLEDALREYELAVELDRNDARSKSRLRVVFLQMQAREFTAPHCPRCDYPLRGDFKSCTECGWSLNG